MSKTSTKRKSSGLTREEYVEKMKRKKNNVGNKSSSNKKNKKKAKKESTPKQKLLKFILLLILVAIIIMLVNAIISMVSFGSMAKSMVQNLPSTVVDSSGNEITKIGEERNRENISLSEMPENLKNAYVAIEDQRFYNHLGIDIRRTGAATLSYIKSFGHASFGGSTITQQLVKNLTGNTDSKVSRKFEEWKYAIALEVEFSKDEILEAYLNIIYVGPNVYGVQMGSKYYFNKSAKDLSLAECAYLAGINNSPNSYNPFRDGEDNSEKIEKRTKTVLQKMLELGYIEEAQYNETVSEVEKGLDFDRGDIEITKNIVYSYNVDALISELISDLAEEKNISEDFAENYIYMGNLKIYSTQKTDIQNTMETEFNKNKYILQSDKNSGETSQAAMVVIEQSTGYVVGTVGGLGEKTSSRGFNRATQAKRQTGSSMKPIAILAPGIEEKVITASSVFDDTQTTFTDYNNEEYTPENYDAYLGKITVRRAVESSQNIPFVYMMQLLTPKKSVKYLKEMGVTNLTSKDENLSLALGGLDKGITPLESAVAYATIANDGVYIEPTFYTKIENSSGKVVFETTQETRRVFSEETAYIVKSLLTEPVQGTYGTATYCKISGIDVAAKTGTTNENYDRWLCGFTPYYTATTWYGYDENETVNYGGKNPAGLIWANVMKNIHSDLENASFEKPSGVQTATICAASGELATGKCKSTYEEYFLKGTIPGMCSIHSDGTSSYETNTDVVQPKIQTEQDVVIEEPTRTQAIPENNNIQNQTSNTSSENTSIRHENENSNVFIDPASD